MINLYNDQLKCLHLVLSAYRQGYHSPLLVAPCGFGKTVVFSEIARRAYEKGNSVLICVHRKELLRQVCDTLKRFEVPYGIIASGYCADYNEKIQVASIQTLCRWQAPIKPTMIIIDECHHAVSPSFKKVINRYNNSKILGVTATPCRANGEGLNSVFDTMIVGAYADDLIARGRLCKPVYYAPPQLIDLSGLKTKMGDYEHTELEKRTDKPHITGDVIEHYKRLCNGKKAVVFCVSRRHAENVAIQFMSAGVPCNSIDGSLSNEDRIKRIKDFASGKLWVLTSCELISEGFDLPTIEVAIMLRPTQSLAVWIQQAGRALRVAEGKKEAIILDHCGNIFRHGAIETIKNWSLDGIKKRTKKTEYTPAVRRCKSCFRILSAGCVRCPECGSEPEISERELKVKEGELKAIEIESLKIERKQAYSLEALIELGIKRGYKNPRGWAYYVMKGRQNKRG